MATEQKSSPASSSMVGLSRLRAGALDEGLKNHTMPQNPLENTLDSLFSSETRPEPFLNELPMGKSELRKSEHQGRAVGLGAFRNKPQEPMAILPVAEVTEGATQTGEITKPEFNQLYRKIYETVSYLTEQLGKPEVNADDLQLRLAVLKELVPLLNNLQTHSK